VKSTCVSLQPQWAYLTHAFYIKRNRENSSSEHSTQITFAFWEDWAASQLPSSAPWSSYAVKSALISSIWELKRRT